jgi:hypothetical protein
VHLANQLPGPPQINSAPAPQNGHGFRRNGSCEYIRRSLHCFRRRVFRHSASFPKKLPQRLDLDSLGAYVSNLAAAGMPLFPDDDLRRSVRRSSAAEQALGLLFIKAELVAEPGHRADHRRSIRRAHIRATANVAGALYKSALKGSNVAQIFWLKTQAV